MVLFFVCMEKSSVNILHNFSFCVTLKKICHMGLGFSINVLLLVKRMWKKNGKASKDLI